MGLAPHNHGDNTGAQNERMRQEHTYCAGLLKGTPFKDMG